VTEIGTFEHKEQGERHRCLRVALVAKSCISTGAVSYKTVLIGLSKIGEQPHRVRALWPTRRSPPLSLKHSIKFLLFGLSVSDCAWIL
jgi:hypothetical protein